MEVNIPNSKVLNDLTIIYKGKEEREGQIIEEIEEIETSKEEFLRKLRYFKPKYLEISQQKEIFIHDSYPINVFRLFISALTTDRILLNDDNYMSIKNLSIKYGYSELQQVVEKFCSERPDIVQIVDNYLADQIDFEKEEQISMHLDICLQNESMLCFPTSSLIRIINSPRKVLKNHHLLFKFIKKIIDKRKSEKSDTNNNSDEDENEQENLQILLSSLDYNQLSNDELKELFENEDFSNVFNFKGSKEMICTLLDENSKKGERISALETKIENLEDKINEEQLKFENHNQQKEKEKNEMNMRIEIQEKTIKKCEDFLEKQQKFIETQNMKIEELENQLKLIQNNSEEELKKQQKIIEEQRKKINEIEQDVLNKAKNEQEKQQKSIDSHGKKIVELESKIDQCIKNIKLEGTITVNVEQDQTIKGIIDIKEKGSKIDKKRSKYILNTNSSSQLGSNSYNNGFQIEKLKQEVSFKKSAGTYYLHALLIDNFGNETELVSKAVKTKGVVLSYKFTGRVEAVTLDPGSYKLEVWGAEGGKNGNYKDISGKGGYSFGTLTLKEKKKLYIYVGESPSGMNGGWNGGGSGTKHPVSEPAAGGGGSTDISLYGEEGSSNWNNNDHLYSRIIVAGAGGGSAHYSISHWYGGFGGGLNGQSSGHDEDTEYGGSQTKAGKSNSYSKGQGFGVGGSHTNLGSSGGGGGWYGGSAPNEQYNAAGGSGGSGYVYNSSTASNYPSGCKLNSSFYLTNSKTESGDQMIPNPCNSSTEKGHSGHGYAKITPL